MEMMSLEHKLLQQNFNEAFTLVAVRPRGVEGWGLGGECVIVSRALNKFSLAAQVPWTAVLC